MCEYTAFSCVYSLSFSMTNDPKFIFIYYISIMRHRAKTTKEYDSWIQKISLLLRNMLTSLVIHGKVVTTSKRSYMLKAYANHFFASLVTIYRNHDEVYARRESIRRTKAILFGKEAWKKFVDSLLPSFVSSSKSSFISDVKLWVRKWDNAEEVLLQIVS